MAVIYSSRRKGRVVALSYLIRYQFSCLFQLLFNHLYIPIIKMLLMRRTRCWLVLQRTSTRKMKATHRNYYLSLDDDPRKESIDLFWHLILSQITTTGTPAMDTAEEIALLILNSIIDKPHFIIILSVG